MFKAIIARLLGHWKADFASSFYLFREISNIEHFAYLYLHISPGLWLQQFPIEQVALQAKKKNW